jgi:hypothetical protein
MRKAFITCGLGLALLAYLFFPPPQAQATVCTAFHVWQTGDTITAANLNGNNNNLITCGNAIDNTNIGSAGIYASQIKPTSTAQAAFGGAQNYTFPQDLIFTASAATSPTSVAIWNDNGSTNGLFLNVPTGSTNGVTIGVNGVGVASIASSGAISAGTGTVTGASDGATNTYYAPVYGHAGATPAPTEHSVSDTVSITVSATCTAASGGAKLCSESGTTAITFSNAAVFTGSTTYECHGVLPGLSGSGVDFEQTNGTTVGLFIYALDGTTITAAAHTVAYTCTGT